MLINRWLLLALFPLCSAIFAGQGMSLMIINQLPSSDPNNVIATMVPSDPECMYHVKERFNKKTIPQGFAYENYLEQKESGMCYYFFDPTHAFTVDVWVNNAGKIGEIVYYNPNEMLFICAAFSVRSLNNNYQLSMLQSNCPNGYSNPSISVTVTKAGS